MEEIKSLIMQSMKGTDAANEGSEAEASNQRPTTVFHEAERLSFHEMEAEGSRWVGNQARRMGETPEFPSGVGTAWRRTWTRRKPHRHVETDGLLVGSACSGNGPRNLERTRLDLSANLETSGAGCRVLSI